MVDLNGLTDNEFQKERTRINASVFERFKLVLDAGHWRYVAVYSLGVAHGAHLGHITDKQEGNNGQE